MKCNAMEMHEMDTTTEALAQFENAMIAAVVSDNHPDR